MCVVCWQEFDDCVNPPVDLGCGHYGCGPCRDAIRTCPVCHSAVIRTPNSKKQDVHDLSGIKLRSTPRRRCRSDEEQLGDIFDDDHLAPAMLGSADEATAPRVRMLERAPSSAAGSVPSRQYSSALSARHLARGGFAAGRTALTGALVPAARLSFRVSRSVLNTTCRAASCTGQTLARATCSLVKFAIARRCSIIGYDGDQQPLAACPDDPTEAQSQSREQFRRRSRRGHSNPGAAIPEPLSNIAGGRITLRDCRNTRLRIEYCRDCVVVASNLESVELLLVCCQRIKLVMRNSSGLLLRELQCSNMGDFVRRGCPNFTHEIVCLRCACKPMSNGAGSYSAGLVVD